jgi:hypothetical protein
MCGVRLEFHSTQLGDRSPSGFLLLLNLAIGLPMCQERQEGNRRSSVCILGTRTREVMKEFRVSGVIVVAAISFVNFGGFLCGHKMVLASLHPTYTTSSTKIP